MNPKLVLAESLEVFRRAESLEAEADRLQEAIAKSGKLRGQLGRLKKVYSHSYDTFVHGLELMNFVRRVALTANERELAKFCETRMTQYMDHCDTLRNKEASILLPLSQMKTATQREGYVQSELLVKLSPTHPVTKKAPWKKSMDVADGSYVLSAKNMDDYSVAAPAVTVEATLHLKTGSTLSYHKIIPGQCGWVRFIGVVGSGQLQVEVASDAVVRECHVELEIHRHEEVAGADTAWMSSLPRLDDVVPAEEPLPALPPPPAASAPRETAPAAPHIAVQPKGVGVRQRMDLIRRALDSWPNDNVKATPLSRADQMVIQAVHQLPIPTELCGNMDDFAGDFHVTGDDLEPRDDD